MFCSDATLRRNCALCTTASYEELKDATCFRERWRFRARDLSYLAGSPRRRSCPSWGLEPSWRSFSRRPRGTRWFLPCRELRPGCGFRRGLDSVGTVPDSTVKACAPAGLLRTCITAENIVLSLIRRCPPARRGVQESARRARTCCHCLAFFNNVS